MAWARSAIGAKRSSRSSPAVSLSHFSAALMAGMAALPRTASRATGNPRRELDGQGPPAVLAPGQLGGGGVAQGLDLGAQALRSHLEVAREAAQLRARAGREHLLPVGEALEGGRAQLVEADAAASSTTCGDGTTRVSAALRAASASRPADGRGGRGLAEGGRFLLLLLVPLRVERALAVADGAPAVAVRVVERERRVEQVRELPRAAGDGARDLALRLVRLAQAVGGPGDVLDRWARSARPGAAGCRPRSRPGRPSPPRRPGRAPMRSRSHSLRSSASTTSRARSSSVNVARSAATIFGCISAAALCAFSRWRRASRRRSCDGDEILEAEDRGQPVVELGRPLVEHRAELVVAEAGPVAAQRLVPAQRGRVRPFLPADLGRAAPALEGVALLPREHERAGLGLALQRELGLDGGVRMVEVAPAVLPDLGAVEPAVGLAGQQQLEAFGEAGLAGAVAADDEGQARARGAARG